MTKYLYLFPLTLLFFSHLCGAANGKLLATPGVSQVEGSAGGGLVPWAQLAGYASEDEIAINGFCSRASVSDYRLDVCGAQLNWHDRIELSYAHQRFDVPALELQIEQNIFAAKIRIYGDLVYSRWPQLSAGIQHKRLQDPLVANLLGARHEQGTDLYLSASKLHLGAAFGYNWLWNLTGRYTQANQLGLLGFGAENKHASLQFETSTAVLLNNHLAFGIEYRQKPDQLGIKEDDWQDIFIAWFPNKTVSFTLAWLDLGSIAGANNQTGWYLSVNGYL